MGRFIPLLLLVLVATPAPAQEKSGARPAPAITGQVIGDDGRPVPYAGIRAFPVGAGSWSAAITAQADDEGRFTLSGVDARAYQLSVSAPGYVPETQRDADGNRAPYFRPGGFATLRVRRGGVITGTVTEQDGEPLISVPVRAFRVRDEDGRRMRSLSGPWTTSTDDRGVYRLFGLFPGTYVVSACGKESYWPIPTPYDDSAPTYHPSSMRDGATEVTVGAGDEVEGVDIRFRVVTGFTVAGSVLKTGTTGGDGILIGLSRASTGEPVAETYVADTAAEARFKFANVPDGEYLATARMYNKAGSATSAPKRVVVRGANVSGVTLLLAPMASIGGRVVLETPKDGERPDGCPKDGRRVEEAVVTIYRDGPGEPSPFDTTSSGAAPDGSGLFAFKDLTAGRYRARASLASDDWYFKAIAIPGLTATNPDRDVVSVAAGGRLDGIVFTIGRSAAGMRGKVTPAADGDKLPDRLRVYLVPADPALAEEPLRYYEAVVEQDGAFAARNLAPGAYLIVARVAPAAAEAVGFERPVSWTKDGRAALRRDAAKAKPTELAPCQRVGDLALQFVKARSN
jgi:hypothetical protein